MPTKEGKPPPKPTSTALVAKGQQGLTGGNVSSRKTGTRPSTTLARDLVLRNGKYGTAGTGEMQLFSKKLSGQEKFSLIANDRLQNAVRAPFNLELLLKKAESQFELYLSQINNLRDDTFFYDDILIEMEASTAHDPKNKKSSTDNPAAVAAVVGYYVHNMYVLAASWKAVYDILRDIASKNVTSSNVKNKLGGDSSIRQRFNDLSEVLQNLTRMGLGRVQTLATASEHFARYFTFDDEGFVSFDESRLKDFYKSYADSIAIELLLPDPRYPLHILLAMLKECFDEAPKESRRFSAAMWNAVGDLAVTVDCLDNVEMPQIGLPPLEYEMHETMRKFRHLQTLSAEAASNTESYRPLVQPLTKLKQKVSLAELWETIDAVYIEATGQTIDALWGVSMDLIPHPQWTQSAKTGLGSISEEASKKKPKKLLTNAAHDEDDDMPALLTVSDSSDMIEDSDDYFSEEEGEYDDSEYDTDDEDHIRELLREAMDTASANPELLDPTITKEEPEEVKNNSFLKALRNLRGKLFSRDPALTVDNQPRSSYLKTERPPQKATGKAAPQGSSTSASRQPTSMAATVEDADDEDAPKKKKKKKKPKKKKKKATADAAGADGENDDEEDEEVPPPPAPQTVPPPAAPATPPKAKEKPKSATPVKQPSASASQQSPLYSNGAFGSTSTLGTTGQSAHSYLKKEGLLDQTQGKVKSRPEPGSVPSAPARKLFGKSKNTEPGEKSGGLISKLKSNVIHLREKSHTYLTRLISKSDDAFKGKGSMRWDQFVKVMTEIGFTVDSSTAGSSVRFDPPNPEDKSITIHKPHPDPTLPPIMIKRIGKRLRDRYDWTEDQFISQGAD